MTAFPTFPTSPDATSYVGDIVHLPLSELYLSPLNPRQEVDMDGIELLAASLLDCGLIHPLAGLRDASGKVGVVAGGRRLRALQLAAATNPDLAIVPVKIAASEEVAKVWGMAENIAREDMDPVTEILAYKKMIDTGNNVAAVARAFSVTEAHVYRRLKLSCLPSIVLDALRAKDLSIDQAAAFTISSDMEAIERVLGHALRGHSSAYEIRRMLTNDKIEGTDRRAIFVGEADYEANGGTFERDLFSEKVLFLNGDILETAFMEKLAAAAEASRLETGAKWVEVTDDSYFYDWHTDLKRTKKTRNELTVEQRQRLEEIDAIPDDLDEATLKELAEIEQLDGSWSVTPEHMTVSGYIALVDFNGKLSLEGPFVKPEDFEAAVSVGALSETATINNTAADKKDSNAFSQALTEDMRAIKLHAFQSAMRADPTKVLSLLAFSLSHFDRYSGLFELSPSFPSNEPSVADGFTADAVLLAKENTSRPADVEISFAEFSQKPTEEILSTLAAELVKTMASGFGHNDDGRKDLFSAFGIAVDASPRNFWTPTKENFWKRINTQQLDAVFMEMTGLADGSDVLRDFLKLKKGQKADKLHMLFNDTGYQSALKLTKKQLKAIAVWWPEQI